MTFAVTPTDFSVRIRFEPEMIISLCGELDLATAQLLEAALDELDFSSLRRVVLDLEPLAFIDVRGLRVVLRLHATCLERSVALTIRPGPRAVQRVFELTGTDRVLPFAPV